MLEIEKTEQPPKPRLRITQPYNPHHMALIIKDIKANGCGDPDKPPQLFETENAARTWLWTMAQQFPLDFLTNEEVRLALYGGIIKPFGILPKLKENEGNIHGVFVAVKVFMERLSGTPLINFLAKNPDQNPEELAEVETGDETLQQQPSKEDCLVV